MSYAYDPIPRSDGEGRPIDHAISTDLVASVGLGERLGVGVDAPFFLWQRGSEVPSSVVAGGHVPTSGLGDIALLGKATVVSNARDGWHAGPGLAMLGSMSLPTGSRTSFAGEGAVTASIRVLAEMALFAATASASLGFAWRPDHRTWPAADAAATTFGNSIPWAAGVSVRPGAIQSWLDPGQRQTWEIAVTGALPAGPTAPLGLGGGHAELLSPAQLAIGDRLGIGTDQDAFISAGFEIGLDRGLGVPPFRGILSIGWAPRSHDRDGDGVPDDRDLCPDLPEDRDGIQDDDGCPDEDADGDGVLDPEDACPLVPGAPADNPKTNGCVLLPVRPTEETHP
jgi:hypothetical protein